MKIKVIQLDGQELSFWGAFSRQGGYGAGFATGLMGFLQVFWDPNRQAIQDKVASTVVIKLNQPKKAITPLIFIVKILKPALLAPAETDFGSGQTALSVILVRQDRPVTVTKLRRLHIKTTNKTHRHRQRQ